MHKLRDHEVAARLATSGFDYSDQRKTLRLLSEKPTHVSIFVLVEFPGKAVVDLLKRYGDLKSENLRRLYSKRKALLTLSVESVWRNLSNFTGTHPVASPLRALKSTSNTQGKLQPATGTILKYMFATVINIAFDQWQLNASKPPGKGGSYPSSPRPSAENEENEDDMDHESETTTTSNLPQSQPASYAEVSDMSNTSTSSFAFWLS